MATTDTNPGAGTEFQHSSHPGKRHLGKGLPQVTQPQEMVPVIGW